MKLSERIKLLERGQSSAPLVTIEVTKAPTPEQQALIGKCIATGRQLLVFVSPGDTVWMPGCGVAPWQAEHGKA